MNSRMTCARQGDPAHGKLPKIHPEGLFQRGRRETENLSLTWPRVYPMDTQSGRAIYARFGGEGPSERASNRRTTGPRTEAGFQGRHAPRSLSMGDTIMQGPGAAHAVVMGQGERERSDCRWGLGSAEGSPMVRKGSMPYPHQWPEGCNGRAQRLPCQDALYEKILIL